MNKLLVLLGAIALTFTLATAEGKCSGDKCNGAKTEKKCASGKCSGDKNNTKKCNAGKCSGDKEVTPKAPAKGKCGQGKCG